MKEKFNKKNKPNNDDSVKAETGFEILPKGMLDKIRNKEANIVIKTLNIFATPVNYNKKRPQLTSGWKRHLFNIIMLLVVLFLGALGFFFWFIFSPKIAPVEIEISHWPVEVFSGSEVTYQVRYKNESDNELYNAHLALDLPSNFRLHNYDDLAGFDTQNNTFILGNLKPGASGKLEFSGYLWAEVDSTQRLKTTLSCQTDKDRKMYRIDSYGIEIGESLLGVDYSIADKAYDQTIFEIIFEIKNNSDNLIENANLVVEYPTTYKINNIETELEYDNFNKFKINNLGSGESQQIILEGHFEEDLKSESVWRDFSGSLYLDIDGQELLQDSFSKSVEVDFARFDFKPSLSQISVSPGDSFNYKLNYQNQEDYNIENLKLWLEVESYFINYDRSDLGGANLEDENKIIWSDLNNLDYYETGEVEVDLSVFSQMYFSDYDRAKNLRISLTPRASYNLANNPNQEISAVGETSYILINSDLKLSVQARYFSEYGDQLGVGPLPPVVDEETRYWIGIKIANTTNEVEDLNLFVDLPASVSWTGKTSVSHGPAIIYKSEDHRVSWSLDNLETHVGQVKPAYRLGFEVGVVPSENQIGEILTLVNSINLTGKDSFTGAELVQKTERLTTELIYDDMVGLQKYRVEEW